MRNVDLENMNTARLYAAHTILFYDTLAKYLGLSATDMKCLTVLNCYGPMTPGELAERSGVTTGGVTKVLDKLETRDFIEREYSAKDRRSQVIRPTLPTAVHSNKMRKIELHSVMDQLASTYTEKEFAIIMDFMRRSTALIQESVKKLREEIARDKRVNNSMRLN